MLMVWPTAYTSTNEQQKTGASAKPSSGICLRKFRVPIIAVRPYFDGPYCRTVIAQPWLGLHVSSLSLIWSVTSFLMTCMYGYVRTNMYDTHAHVWCSRLCMCVYVCTFMYVAHVHVWCSRSCMYVYVCTFMCVAHVHVCTFMYVRSCMMLTFMYVRLCMYGYVCTFMYVRSCMYVHVCCSRSCMMRTFMYVQLCMYGYVRTNMYDAHVYHSCVV